MSVLYTMEKNIFTQFSDLTTYLQTKGFSIVDAGTGTNKYMYYTAAGVDTTCHWIIKNGSQINFMRSDNEEAFDHYAQIDSDNNIGCVYIPLTGNGCLLYLTSFPKTASITQLQINCKNEYEYDDSDPPQKVPVVGQILNNGLVAVTPAESDGYWRYSWRSKSIDGFYWEVDNGHGAYEYAPNTQQIPPVKMHQAEQCMTLVKVALQTGGWSQHLYTLVLGSIVPPTSVFKTGGQKFLAVTDNTTQRCPVFRLPAEQTSHNISTSTEEYSNFKTYLRGDFCIYDNVLYKCIQNIEEPMPFDPDYWTVTTVHNEIMSQSIYNDLGN